MMQTPAGDISNAEAAALLGVTPRTLYRWVNEGRLSYPIMRADILSRKPTVRPRGPRRNPYAKRYLYGRHSPNEVRPSYRQKKSGNPSAPAPSQEGGTINLPGNAPRPHGVNYGASAVKRRTALKKIKGVANMNQAIKEQWLQALRSGEYRQGRGNIRVADAYCCLGVLCDLAAKAGVDKWRPCEWKSQAFTFDGEVLLLPIVVQTWAGLETRNPLIKGYYGVADFNDGSVPDKRPRNFQEIADLIEAKL